MFIEIMAHIVTIEYIIMEKYNISNKTMKEWIKENREDIKEQLKKEGENMKDFEKEYKEMEQQVERCQNLITAIIMALVIMILLVSYQLGLYLKELETKQENIRKLSIENEDLKEQIYVLQMKGDN